MYKNVYFTRQNADNYAIYMNTHFTTATISMYIYWNETAK